MKERFRSSSVMANPKIVHIIVIIIALFLVIANLTARAKTQSASNIVGGTIISNLVGNEFGDQVDEELIQETSDENQAKSPVPQKYLNNQSCLINNLNAGQSTTKNTEEESYLSDQLPSTQGGSALVRPDIVATQKIIRPRTEIVYHTVQAGETISTIAEQYAISVNTILWENNLTAFSLIRPGDNIAILPFTGIGYTIVSGDSVSKIAGRYNVLEKDIVNANKLIDSTNFKIGQKILIPGGRKIVQIVSNDSLARKVYSGLSVIKNLIQPKSLNVSPGNKMIWPTVGYRITQYYSWRHQAIDIANHVGTPEYAADSGIVEIAGWSNGGYGNTIVINHGGGKKTRYGHLSKLYVCVGQKVSKGEAIGAMGSTGHSTGPHLHFEVIINGVKYNPLSFVK